MRPSILEAQSGPILHHRGAAFQELFSSLQSGLQYVFRTERPVYIATSSATGLMEAAVRCARPGPVLSLVNGAFAQRFAEIARECGREVVVLESPWGACLSLDRVEAGLQSRAFSAVTVVHSETSTGVLSPLREVSSLCRRYGALTLADSVSGAGGTPLETDEWELDFVFTGSQKALALPAGLSFAVASPRYLAAVHEAPNRGRYFDVLEFERFAERLQTPTTPAISLLHAAHRQLADIETETLGQRFARHSGMASLTREWVKETRDLLDIDLGMLADTADQSPTVSCLTLPSEIAGDALLREVAARGFLIGEGYGELRNRTIRIGHMGDHTLEGLSRCLEVVGTALERLRQPNQSSRSPK